MDRLDAIIHYEKIRKNLVELLKEFTECYFDDISAPEKDRTKKTTKIFADLIVRLFEDQAIMEKIRKDKIERGEVEQGSLFDKPDKDDAADAANEADDDETDGDED